MSVEPQFAETPPQSQECMYQPQPNHVNEKGKNIDVQIFIRAGNIESRTCPSLIIDEMK